MINKHKMAKHLILDIGDDRLAWRRDQAAVDAEAALDGLYVIRTPLPADRLDAAGTVTAYENLSRVERDFRSIKPDDLDLRPIHHWLEDRVRAHVLICMLAAYLTWHLRKTLAPLTYTGEQPPDRANPIAPARRSAHADIKAAAHNSADGQILRSFRGVPRPPRHPDPQHRHHRRSQLRENQRSDPCPAPRLRPPRDPDPADPHPEVDRAQALPRQTRSPAPHRLTSGHETSA